MGFSFATHYCGGKAVKSKLMLGNGDLDCGMAKMDEACESETTTVSKKSCCENHFLSLEVEDDFQPSVIPADIDLNFVYTFVYTFIELLNSGVEQEIAYRDYSPPLRNIDVQVMFQSFLI